MIESDVHPICPECGTRVSRRRGVCPHCGLAFGMAPLKGRRRSNPRRRLTFSLASLMGFVSLCAVFLALATAAPALLMLLCIIAGPVHAIARTAAILEGDRAAKPQWTTKEKLGAFVSSLGAMGLMYGAGALVLIATGIVLIELIATDAGDEDFSFAASVGLLAGIIAMALVAYLTWPRSR